MSSRVSASKRPPQKSAREVATVRPEISELLGPPPLCAGEAVEDYELFSARLYSSVAPQDAIEELYVRDIADLTWEILRLRRLKAKLMVSARSNGLFRLLDRLVEAVDEVSDDASDGEREEADDTEEEGHDEVYYSYDDDEEVLSAAEERRNALHAGWLRGDREAVEEIDRLLKQAGYDFEVVDAEALTMKFDDFDRIDGLIATADSRRNGVLRELERHRAAFARRLRDAASEVEDAEFEDVIDGEAAA